MDRSHKIQLDDERCQQKRIAYESLKKMRRSRRPCRFMACIGIASNPFNFPSLEELCYRTSGLKHSSFIQYVIVYQKSCMLIRQSNFCYLSVAVTTESKLFKDRSLLSTHLILSFCVSGCWKFHSEWLLPCLISKQIISETASSPTVTSRYWQESHVNSTNDCWCA